MVVGDHVHPHHRQSPVVDPRLVGIIVNGDLQFPGKQHGLRRQIHLHHDREHPHEQDEPQKPERIGNGIAHGDIGVDLRQGLPGSGCDDTAVHGVLGGGQCRRAGQRAAKDTGGISGPQVEGVGEEQHQAESAGGHHERQRYIPESILSECAEKPWTRLEADGVDEKDKPYCFNDMRKFKAVVAEEQGGEQNAPRRAELYPLDLDLPQKVTGPDHQEQEDGGIPGEQFSQVQFHGSFLSKLSRSYSTMPSYRKSVSTGTGNLDVHNWCVVQDLQRFHHQGAILLHGNHPDFVKTDGVGAIRRSRAKYSGQRIFRVPPRMHLEGRAIGPVQPGQDDDPGSRLHSLQGTPKSGFDLQPSGRCPFRSLAGTLGSYP